MISTSMQIPQNKIRPSLVSSNVRSARSTVRYRTESSCAESCPLRTRGWPAARPRQTGGPIPRLPGGGTARQHGPKFSPAIITN